jgi:hypothetical protein
MLSGDTFPHLDPRAGLGAFGLSLAGLFGRGIRASVKMKYNPSSRDLIKIAFQT